MRIRTILAAGTAALVAGLAAGCGGGTNGSAAAAGGSLGGGAAVAPADAAAFVAIDSDLGSSQWNAVDSLLSKAGLLTQLRQGVQKQTGVSWNDLEAVLGPELDVVVLPGSGAEPQVVLLAQPSDSAKFGALVAKAGPKVSAEAIGGWTAVSDSASALDAVSGATQHLADDSLYKEATGKLAGGAFAQVYANGAEAARLASSLGGGNATASTSHLVWAAADLTAASDGVRVDGFVRGDDSTPAPQPYASTLVDRIPSGALLVADFQARHDEPAATTPASPLVTALGKVADALGGETALYVTPGAPFPAVTLVTQPSDPQAALGAIDQALSGAAAGAKGGLGALLGGLRLAHEQVGSDLVVSTSQAAIDAFKGSGAKLSADPAFRQAAVPEQTTGFVYADLKDALPALKGLLAGAGGGSLPDLSALQTLTAYGTGSTNGVAGFTAFLGVR